MRSPWNPALRSGSEQGVGRLPRDLQVCVEAARNGPGSPALWSGRGFTPRGEKAGAGCAPPRPGATQPLPLGQITLLDVIQ